MTEFLRSNPKLDEVIRNATTVDELRESMLAELAKQGTIVRDNRDAFNTRVVPRPPQPPAPVSSSLSDENRMRKASDTWSRYVIDGNSHFELFGDSEQDLNEQESRIRAILSAERTVKHF